MSAIARIPRIFVFRSSLRILDWSCCQGALLYQVYIPILGNLQGVSGSVTGDPCGVWGHTVYPKKYAHGFCFAVLCCGYTLTDFPISIRPTSLALWQSNDCPSASKATLMNMDKYFMWIHYERLRNHNKAKHNKTVCIFLGIYCRLTTCRLCMLIHFLVNLFKRDWLWVWNEGG